MMSSEPGPKKDCPDRRTPPTESAAAVCYFVVTVYGYKLTLDPCVLYQNRDDYSRKGRNQMYIGVGTVVLILVILLLLILLF